MVFNSITFLLFFIAFFILYWIINNKTTVNIRNGFTIIASYIFYGWWDWRFLSLIAFSSLVDFLIGLALNKQHEAKYRKLLLYLSVAANLGILGVFKYFNFFVSSFSAALELFSIEVHTTTLNIILPVGISFYTFQTLSYTIDIYHKKLQPTRNPISFFAFVSYFPQLVAGPIERASRLLHQFDEKKKFNPDECTEGLRLILWGFFKKLVIADNFGVLVDSIFEVNQNISGVSYLLGSLFFGLQIYADFSGYSDIAIGISKTLGYNLMANFKTPYFSHSLNEFWQRWHISLSSWFKDYLYIPLGGNRKSKHRVQFNLLFTFLLSGLWHGANLTFLIWGALHGTALVIEKQFQFRPSKWIYTPFVFLLVMLFWLPFRAESNDHFIEICQSIVDVSAYTLNGIKAIVVDFSNLRFLSLSLTTVFFFSVEWRMKLLNFNDWLVTKNTSVRYLLYYVLIFAIIFLGNFSVKPSFIYFQF